MPRPFLRSAACRAPSRAPAAGLTPVAAACAVALGWPLAALAQTAAPPAPAVIEWTAASLVSAPVANAMMSAANTAPAHPR